MDPKPCRVTVEVHQLFGVDDYFVEEVREFVGLRPVDPLPLQGLIEGRQDGIRHEGRRAASAHHSAGAGDGRAVRVSAVR